MLMADELVSIIVRTKNEERWIAHCLNKIKAQTYSNTEVVLVDNMSSDRTVEKAKAVGIDKLVEIDEFRPGKAINDGIRVSSGDYIVCISGHCVPETDSWLEKLIAEFTSESVGGVYGRQKPLSFTSDLDKRDLLTVFGLDKRVQVKDGFFHNANSAIRRDVWQKFNFDESVAHIEDRIWGQKIIEAGYNIVYTPEASVYHWHGINHSADPVRAKNIVKILNSIRNLDVKSNNQNRMGHDQVDGNRSRSVDAIIPLKGSEDSEESLALLKQSIKCLRSVDYVNRVFVTTSSQRISDFASDHGAISAWLRPKHLDEEYMDLRDVLFEFVQTASREGIEINVVLVNDPHYIFRQRNDLCAMIDSYFDSECDSLVAGIEETRTFWKMSDFDSSRGKTTDENRYSFMPSSFKEEIGVIGLNGFGFITSMELISSGDVYGERINIFPLKNKISALKLNDSTLTGELELLKSFLS
ncbi:glycosyltransferase [Litorivicinus sp.]|nr:glycosyltransferase [Litorivicinus sp.]